VVELRADCSRCVGLCCVAPAFARSADFAVDKPAGTPCTNLQADFRCAIHADLRDRGFAGCTVFDCLGAGQRVTAAFAGRDWRTPEVAAPMFAAFAVARQVHELLWYLDEARERAPDPALDAEWGRLVDADLAASDVDATRQRVGELLRAASERLRAPADREHGVPRAPGRPVGPNAPGAGERVTAAPTQRGETPDSPSRRRLSAANRRTHRGGTRDSPSGKGRLAGAGADHSRADLVGVRWPEADLRRASLRGALLLGADLRGADLRLADLLGADLRGADLRGADLSTSLFLTPMQAAAARGDAATRLPARVPRPAHWPGRDQS
jgi:Pentapeptide repeats (8 copies)